MSNKKPNGREVIAVQKTEELVDAEHLKITVTSTSLQMGHVPGTGYRGLIQLEVWADHADSINKIAGKLQGIIASTDDTLHEQAVQILQEDLEKEKQKVARLETELAQLHIRVVP